MPTHSAIYRLSNCLTFTLAKFYSLVDDMYLLDDTLSALKAGQLIVYPTDTVWGIGCDATNPEAVARVLDFKQRKAGTGLVTLVDSLDALRRYIDVLHPRLQTVLELHRRPLTMIYPDAKGLAKGVIAADGSAAIRVTNDPYLRSLISKLGRPIVSTSANLPGEAPPTHFGGISSAVLQTVDHVAKYRQREPATNVSPSVIARWTDNNELEPIRS